MLTTLEKVYENKKAMVTDIQGGQGVRQRLGQMGIHPGDTITMLRYGALRGPIPVSYTHLTLPTTPYV